MRTLFAVGSEFEAYRLAPVILALRTEPRHHRVRVCVTGRAPARIREMLGRFRVRPDVELGLSPIAPDQAIGTNGPLKALSEDLTRDRSDAVIVQSGTESAGLAGLASLNTGAPLVEVGSGSWPHRYGPGFSPEEDQLRMHAKVPRVHFAPTPGAARNLIAGGVPAHHIFAVGSTAVEALRRLVASFPPPSVANPPAGDRRLIFVALDRETRTREERARITQTLRAVARRHADDVRLVVTAAPGGPDRGRAVEHPEWGSPSPRESGLPAEAFYRLLSRADLVVTDSGEVHEEAAALDRLVLIPADVAPRPDLLDLGGGFLIGARAEAVESGLETYLRLLNRHLIDPVLPSRSLGDGSASQRISDILRRQPIWNTKPAIRVLA